MISRLMIGNREQTAIDSLLDEAHTSLISRDWSLLLERAEMVLVLDPDST